MAEQDGSITYLTSLSLPPTLMVDRVDMSQEGAFKGIPAGSVTIGRLAAIPVEVQSREGHFLEFNKAAQTIEAVPLPDQIAVSSSRVYADRPAASDPTAYKPDVEVRTGNSVTEGGHPKSMYQGTEVVDTKPITKGVEFQQKNDSMYRPNDKPVESPTAVKKAQVMQAVQAQLVTQDAPAKPKVRVRLSNKNIGRVTVSVVEVAVSESVVILAYDKDAENIYEPPACDSEMPISVEFDNKKYKCIFGGWTAEVAGLYQVILLLDDGSTTSS